MTSLNFQHEISQNIMPPEQYNQAVRDMDNLLQQNVPQPQVYQQPQNINQPPQQLLLSQPAIMPPPELLSSQPAIMPPPAAPINSSNYVTANSDSENSGDEGGKRPHRRQRKNRGKGKKITRSQSPTPGPSRRGRGRGRKYNSIKVNDMKLVDPTTNKVINDAVMQCKIQPYSKEVRAILLALKQSNDQVVHLNENISKLLINNIS